MENFERIERFLKGEMSAAELEAFNRALQTDENLREELEYQRLEEELLEVAARARIRKELEAIKTTQGKVEGKPASPVRLVKRYRRLAVAAGVLLLVLLTGWFYSSWRRSPARIAKVEARAYPPLKLFNLDQDRKGAMDGEDELDALMRLIQTGQGPQLERAVSQLEQKIQEEPDNAFFSYLLAAAYYEQERTAEAESRFEAAANQAGAPAGLRHWAEYYRLLCLLQLGERGEYLPLIEEIEKVGPGHPFYPRVLEMEKKLSDGGIKNK